MTRAARGGIHLAPEADLKAEFFVAGDPHPQPRQRFAARVVGGKAKPVPYRDDTNPIHGWKNTIALHAKFRLPKGWPLGKKWAYRLVVVVVRPARKSDTGDAATASNTKPDGDNYLKGLKDSLKGIAWDDDGRVYDARVLKLRAGKKCPAGTWVLIEAEATPRHVDPHWVKVCSGFGPSSTG